MISKRAKVELNEFHGKPVNVCSDQNMGLSYVAAALESKLPSTSRELYRMGIKIREVEAKNSELEECVGRMHRQLDAIESDDLQELFYALENSDKINIRSNVLVCKLDRFMKQLRDEKLRDELMEQSARWNSPHDHNELHKLFKVDPVNYLDGFGKMVRDAKLLSDTVKQFKVYEVQLPLLYELQELARVIREKNIVVHNKIFTVLESCPVLTKSGDKITIDFVDWTSMRYQDPKYVPKLIEHTLTVSVLQAITLYFGHSDISGLDPVAVYNFEHRTQEELVFIEKLIDIFKFMTED